MKDWKQKTCVRCNKVFKPTSGVQKYCHACIPEARKKFYRFNVKRWRSRKSFEELKKYRQKEYIKNKITYQTNSRYNRNLKRFGGNYYIVLERDNFSCQKCGSKKKLSVHHIDGCGRNVKNPNNKLSNLITFCLKCHSEKHLQGRFKKNHLPFNHS